jgi:hypothetical protein
MVTVSHYHLPSLRVLARRAVPHIVEASLIPLALFYGALWLAGTTGAILTALAWSYAAIGRRLLTGHRVPGLLLLGAAGLTARTAMALASGSVFFYFLQPSLTTLVVAGVFLFSLRAGRPLAERLAADFVVLPPEVLGSPHIRKVFARITLLWALINVFNAFATIALLMSSPLAVYVGLRAIVSAVVLVTGVAVSTRLFKRALATATVTTA